MSNKIRKIFSENIETRWFLSFLFVIGLTLSILRKPIIILLQPGRVEDVDVLLREAIQYSWGSIFVVYNYYLHVIPRLVTIFSLYIFGIGNVNLAMNLAAIVIATLCAVFFATKQFRFIIKSDLLRAICSLFIISAPGINEIYSNISSIQWFLNIFTMLFVVLLLFNYKEFEKKSRKKKYLYTFFCSVSFLSSAFSIVFFPALIYVIIREFRRNRKDIVTIFSYVIPTILLLFQTLLLYTTYSQQYKSSAVNVSEDILRSTIYTFSISVNKIFNSNIFQISGDWVYIIPAIVILFILLNSIKNGLKFEIFTLFCIIATLFWSVIIRGNFAERFLSFAIVFLFILIIRQFDKRNSLSFKLILSVVMIVVILNIMSEFFIQSSADENWKYVKEIYDSTGKYQCYIGEVPHGWAISVPCAKPLSENMTVTSESIGPSITFTPPVVPTITSITSSSSYTISGLSAIVTATVSPTPDSGAIQFHVDDTPIGNWITISGGQSTFSIPSLSVGLHHISASYSGASNFYASKSNQTSIMVLSTSDLRGANLSGMDIQGINLSGANMQGINLSGANMQGINLSKANLQDANLSGALLQGTKLKDSNLSGANLSGAILADSDISGANLSGTNLKDANIKGANFTGTITSDCNGCPQIK